MRIKSKTISTVNTTKPEIVIFPPRQSGRLPPRVSHARSLLLLQPPLSLLLPPLPSPPPTPIKKTQQSAALDNRAGRSHSADTTTHFSAGHWSDPYGDLRPRDLNPRGGRGRSLDDLEAFRSLLEFRLQNDARQDVSATRWEEETPGRRPETQRNAISGRRNDE